MTRKRSALSWIGAAAVFALAFRRTGRDQARDLDRLKPQGALHQKLPSRPSTSGQASGLNAEAPQDIPALGWWQVAQRVGKKFSENELMSEAAAYTFYALLSLFPALTAIVSIYGLFADRSSIEGQLNALAAFLPSGGMDIIRDQVHRLTQSPPSGLSVGAIVGLLTALWSQRRHESDV